MNTVLQFAAFSTTPLELVSFALSLLSVWLTIRQNAWGWLFSILSSATYAVVFFESRLYGDASLQLVFITVSAWGWYHWLHASRTVHVVSEPSATTVARTLAVSRLDKRGWLLGATAWLASFGLLWLFLSRCTDTDVPVIDGFLTAGSLLGQVLLSQKKIENWMVWIAVDILYVGLYAHKGLHVTMVLYTLFIFMAIAGLRTWRRELRLRERA